MAMGDGGMVERDPSGVGRLLLAFGVDRSKDGRNADLGVDEDAILPKEVSQFLLT